MLNDGARNFPAVAVLLLAAALVCALAPPSAPAQAPSAEGTPPSAAEAPPCRPDLLLGEAPWSDPIPLPWQRWRRIMALGKCYMASGDAGLAASLFQQGSAEAPEFEPAWRLNLLRAWIAAGATSEARQLIGDLMAAAQPGAREALRAILTDAIVRGPPAAAAPAYLAEYLVPPRLQPDDYDLVLAMHRLSRGGAAADGRPWRLFLWRGPKDEESARVWSDVPAELTAAGAPPAPEDYLARARQLRRVRAFAALRDEFDPERIAPAATAWPKEQARAIGQIWFSALGRTRQFTLALRSLAGESPRTFAFDPRDTVTLAVEFHLKAGEPATAEVKLNELEALDPKAYILPGFYLDFARRARLRGDLNGMTQWCARTIERFPDHPRAPEAYWMLVWENYRQGALPEAARWAETFLASPSGTGGRERFLYWLGRAYGQLGRAEEAQRAWAPLLAPSRTDFYSLLAQGETLDRLALSAPASERPRTSPGAPEPVELWSQPALLRPVFLLMLGEPALAEPALEEALAASAPPAALRELAVALTRLGTYHLAQKVAVRHFRPEPDAQSEPDPDALKLIYPLAFWDQVNGRPGETLNPFFVLAVIREESHFRADADSSAGAKGLMQLMPATAAAVARDHGLPGGEEALLEPNHNIALGTLYLERLAKRFDGNALHIAASYNAGPTVVRKWLQSMAGLPADEFVESIPYEETQNYVKKVLATSILYRRLYRAP